MKQLLILAAALCLTLPSCYYDKFEDFKPKSQCDTAKVVSYATKVKPIIDAQCNSCHAGTSPQGVINLDTYASAKLSAQSGKLLSSIAWDGKTSQMPKGAATKLDECSIQSISNWISSNYPQ
jgi:uncharacterized membrane protein